MAMRLHLFGELAWAWLELNCDQDRLIMPHRTNMDSFRPLLSVYTARHTLRTTGLSQKKIGAPFTFAGTLERELLD